MGLLDQFSPQQRQLALIGVPAVAAFAVISKLRGADASNSNDAAPTTSGWTMPSTDAIGTGQLADFESLVTNRLNDVSVKTEETGLYTGTITQQLAGQIGSLTQQIAGLKAPPAAQPETYPQPPPAVAPAACPNVPASLVAQMNPGEGLVMSLNAPGGGCWWLTSYGGVFALGGAPFYGSARPHGFGPPHSRRAISIQPLGKGYRVVSNMGENYDFPG